MVRPPRRGHEAQKGLIRTGRWQPRLALLHSRLRIRTPRLSEYIQDGVHLEACGGLRAGGQARFALRPPALVIAESVRGPNCGVDPRSRGHGRHAQGDGRRRYPAIGGSTGRVPDVKRPFCASSGSSPGVRQGTPMRVVVNGRPLIEGDGQRLVRARDSQFHNTLRHGGKRNETWTRLNPDPPKDIWRSSLGH